MTDVARLSTLRHGLHTDAYTFTGTPSLVPLRITDDGASFLPRNRAPLARNLRSLSGRRYSHIRGVQDLADLTVAMEFRGVNSPSGGAVADWEAKMEQGYLLASMFGAVAPATTGAAPTSVTAGSAAATGTLVLSSNVVADGQVVAFSTSTGLHVARVASGGGTTTLTLEHPFTGTVSNGGAVYRCAVYTADDDVTHHIHTMFTAEGEDWRRDYYGCAPLSMSLDLATAGIVGMTSVWSPTSFAADVAEGNPTHAEPVSTTPIVVDACRMWFAGMDIIARDITLTYSNGMAMRTVATRTNGKLGAVASVQPKEYKIEFSVYLGDGNLTGEISQSGTTPSLRDLTGELDSAGDVSTTRELSLQVGTEVGSLLYAFMGAADCVVTTQHVDGLTVARVVATGTGATPGILAVG